MTVVTYCCRPAIKVRSCFSLVRDSSVGVADCSAGCCCCWDIYNSDGSSGDDDDSLYEKEQFSSSELMTNYWLEEWNDIISKKGISKLDRPLRGYCCSPT